MVSKAMRKLRFRHNAIVDGRIVKDAERKSPQDRQKAIGDFD